MVRALSLWVSALLLFAAVGVNAGVTRDTGSTGAADITALNGWIKGLQFQDPTKDGYGAVHVHPDENHYGGGKAWYRVVPYFANQGLTGYVQSNDADRFNVTWNYILWYLDTMETDGSILDQWYTSGGADNTTCPPEVEPEDPQNKCNYEDATDSYAATFLTLVRAYHEASSHTSKFNATIRTDLETIGDLILSLMDPQDDLTWNLKSGTRTKFTLDNAEVYEGLRAMAYIEDTIYGDSVKAKRYGDNATAVQTAILSELYLPSTGAFAVGKAENATTAQAPDSALWYWSGPQQLWPIMTGVVSATDARAVSALTYLDTWWGGEGSPRNWTHNTVDPLGQYWAAAGWAAHVAGMSDEAATHAEYVLCRVTGQYPIEHAFPWPFHVGDAGFLLQSLHAGASLGDGVMLCLPRSVGIWVPAA